MGKIQEEGLAGPDRVAQEPDGLLGIAGRDPALVGLRLDDLFVAQQRGSGDFGVAAPVV
jgi:hypothetical protein